MFSPVTQTVISGGGGGGTTTGITEAQADQRYLRYPIAQGSETLSSIQVDSTAQFQAQAIFNSTLHANQGVTFPNATVQSTAMNTLPPSSVFSLATVTTDANGAISSLSSGDSTNLVTLDGDQTITGQKTFTQTILGNCSTADTANYAYTANTANTATTATTATTAGKIQCTANTIPGNMYVPFFSSAAATAQVPIVSAGLTYDAYASTVTATNFVGTASKATTLAVAPSTTGSTPISILFSPTASGFSQTGTNPNLTFTPSTAVLTATGLSCSNLSIASSATLQNGCSLQLYSSGNTASSAINTVGTTLSFTSPAGGFNFNTSPSTLVASISPTQPQPDDSTAILATTAWVQSAINSIIAPPSPAPVAVKNYTIYSGYLASNKPSSLLGTSITIAGLNAANFFNNLIPMQCFQIRYTYVSWTLDTNAATSPCFSSTGTLMFFPQNISGTYGLSGNFGRIVPQSCCIDNSIGGQSTFALQNNTYANFGRQYFNSNPNAGDNSGWVGAPTSLYVNGAYNAGSAQYGFNVYQPLAGYAWYYSIYLEYVSNPYASTTTVSFSSI